MKVYNCQQTPQQFHQLSTRELGELKMHGVAKLAAKSNSPCKGCNMPRLMFNIVSTELGMDEQIVTAYLALRNQYFGY
jgi:hypothetical protein